MLDNLATDQPGRPTSRARSWFAARTATSTRSGRCSRRGRSTRSCTARRGHSSRNRCASRRSTTWRTSEAGSRSWRRCGCAGVRRIVISSTAAVYGEPDAVPIPEDAPLRPINTYGETKRTLETAADWYSRAYGFRSMALRYFNVAGASDRNGERHDPETHLIPNLPQGSHSGRAIHPHGHRLPDAGRHDRPRLPPRRRPRRRPSARAGGDGVRRRRSATGWSAEPRERTRLRGPRRHLGGRRRARPDHRDSRGTAPRRRSAGARREDRPRARGPRLGRRAARRWRR